MKGTPHDPRQSGWLPDGPAVPEPALREIVERALGEDLAWGDLTTETLVPRGLASAAVMRARAGGVVSGLPVAARVFRMLDDHVTIEFGARDGDRVQAGARLARFSGDARSLLRAERVALNFVQRMSGIASLAARFVAAVEGTGARIVDTRKTTPGLRMLEKYAVRCGGAANHRHTLADAVLIKDNHRASLAAAGIDFGERVSAVRRRLPHTTMMEIEIDRLQQLEEALATGAGAVLLDNMSVAQLREAVQRVDGRALVEASGGVTLETVREIAESGVDLISVGALTHSAPALDIALEWERSGA